MVNSNYLRLRNEQEERRTSLGQIHPGIQTKGCEAGQGWSGSPCHTLKYKLEAVRLVKGGQVGAVTAKILGILEQTIENWVRLAHKSQHRSL